MCGRATVRLRFGSLARARAARCGFARLLCWWRCCVAGKPMAPARVMDGWSWGNNTHLRAGGASPV
eukprot:2815858-Prymnesium_polylepis.1